MAFLIVLGRKAYAPSETPILFIISDWKLCILPLLMWRGCASTSWECIAFLSLPLSHKNTSSSPLVLQTQLTTLFFNIFILAFFKWFLSEGPATALFCCAVCFPVSRSTPLFFYACLFHYYNVLFLWRPGSCTPLPGHLISGPCTSISHTPPLPAF